MNSTETDNKRQSSENLPVFFTGLAETVSREPKIPLLCILCGSSLVNKEKNKNNSLEKNSHNGCENCAKTFNNIKAALDLLSKISSSPLIPSPQAPPNFKDGNTKISSRPFIPSPPNFKDGNTKISSSPFIPSPQTISPKFKDGNTKISSNSETPSSQTLSPIFMDGNANINRNKRKSLLPDPVTPPSNGFFNSPCINKSDYNTQNEHIVRNESPPDTKRKNSFPLNSPKRLRNDCSSSINTYHNSNHQDTTYGKLGSSIWQMYMKQKQTQSVYNMKMTLRDKLHEMLLTAFPTCGLYVVGSSMTGLGAKSSDMDMCLMLTDNEIDQEREATKILHTVHDVFLNCNFLRDVEVIYAKVPILRFTDCVSGIEVDLNVNNAVGIRNTQLLSSYARIDERFPPLVLLVKMWARYHGINDAKNNSLSSYSLVLMVIHFLQYGCRPPVLPCLQQLQPEKYRPNSDVRELKLKEELPDFTSENTNNLGDLFVGFLNYFAHEFDYFRNVMSVRLGGIIPKEICMNNTYSSKNKRAHWKWVCIEEPFDLTNTACAVFKPGVFHYIRQVFTKSCADVKRTAYLGSILQ